MTSTGSVPRRSTPPMAPLFGTPPISSPDDLSSYIAYRTSEAVARVWIAYDGLPMMDRPSPCTRRRCTRRRRTQRSRQRRSWLRPWCSAMRQNPRDATWTTSRIMAPSQL
jgi:hypothetical protein